MSKRRKDIHIRCGGTVTMQADAFQSIMKYAELAVPRLSSGEKIQFTECLHQMDTSYKIPDGTGTFSLMADVADSIMNVGIYWNSRFKKHNLKLSMCSGGIKAKTIFSKMQLVFGGSLSTSNNEYYNFQLGGESAFKFLVTILPFLHEKKNLVEACIFWHNYKSNYYMKNDPGSLYFTEVMEELVNRMKKEKVNYKEEINNISTRFSFF